MISINILISILIPFIFALAFKINVIHHKLEISKTEIQKKNEELQDIKHNIEYNNKLVEKYEDKLKLVENENKNYKYYLKTYSRMIEDLKNKKV